VPCRPTRECARRAPRPLVRPTLSALRPGQGPPGRSAGAPPFSSPERSVMDMKRIMYGLSVALLLLLLATPAGAQQQPAPQATDLPRGGAERDRCTAAEHAPAMICSAQRSSPAL
jgi:hypothetical protein